MKKHIKTILILSLILTSAMVFAQPADPETGNDPAAPIDDYVIGFLIAGLGLAYWKLSKTVKKA